ncbi:MAG: multicopper oxidase family protein [Alphaproteobacteria bacterium]
MSFQLTPAAAAVDLTGGKGPKTAVWAYNGRVPGPELRLKQGQRLRVDVKNDLAEPTTVHWHGLRLPNNMDGVPGLTQPAIEPGQSFTYEFEAGDAGSFWYHPHVNSSEQVGRGLYGALIVEEKTPPQADRELTWIIDDWRLIKDNAIAGNFGNGMDISHGGREGNTLTVNGAPMPDVTVRSGERLRLRLMNVANARIFSLNFEGHAPQVIALDGQPVTPHAPAGGRIILGPGMRADVILDCVGDPGRAGSPGREFRVVDDTFRNRPYIFTTLKYSADKPLRTSPLDAPIALSANGIAKPDLQTAARHRVVIEGGAMGNMQGAIYKGQSLGIDALVQHMKIWSLNGVASDKTNMAPMLTLKQGQSHIITVRNDTGWPHPMHLHGYAFNILSRNAIPVPHTPLADTLLLDGNEEAEIALVADNPGDWLFHCHILDHVTGGMLGVVRVA